MRSLKPVEYGIGMYPALKDEYTGKEINVFWSHIVTENIHSFRGENLYLPEFKRRITSTIVKKWFRGG